MASVRPVSGICPSSHGRLHRHLRGARGWRAATGPSASEARPVPPGEPARARCAGLGYGCGAARPTRCRQASLRRCSHQPLHTPARSSAGARAGGRRMHERRAHESPADRSADDHADGSGEPEPPATTPAATVPPTPEPPPAPPPLSTVRRGRPGLPVGGRGHDPRHRRHDAGALRRRRRLPPEGGLIRASCRSEHDAGHPTPRRRDDPGRTTSHRQPRLPVEPRQDRGRPRRRRLHGGLPLLTGVWRRIPATFADVACAIRVARQRAPRLGGDPSRVTLVAHSYGGFPGAVLALSATDYATNGEGCLATAGDGRPDAFVGIAGVYTLDHIGPEFLVGFFGGDRATAPAAWGAGDFGVLVARKNRRTPPIRLVAGTNDSVSPPARPPKCQPPWRPPATTSPSRSRRGRTTTRCSPGSATVEAIMEATTAASR